MNCKDCENWKPKPLQSDTPELEAEPNFYVEQIVVGLQNTIGVVTSVNGDWIKFTARDGDKCTQKRWNIRHATEGEINKFNKPEFHVEQIVAIKEIHPDSNCTIGQIKELYGSRAILVLKDGQEYDCPKSGIRPANKAEISDFYTRELAGEMVRAYKDENDNIRLIRSNGCWDYLFFSDWEELAKAICKAINLPIMSYEESKRNFKAPKAEK